MDSLIPSSVSHHPGLDAAERYESYRVAASSFLGVEPLREQDHQDARCSGWLVDDLVFCRASFTPSVFRRSSRQARDGGGFLLQIYWGGEQRGEIEGQPLYHDHGRIVIQDLSRPYTAIGHSEDSFAVLFPRHRLEGFERLLRRSPILSWPVTSPRGRILLNTMQSTLETLPDLRQSNAEIVAAGLVGLLSGLASTEKGFIEDEFVNEACLETMKQYLVQHLQDPDLSPAKLGQAFACSRAKIYRLFAEDGGVAAFIRKKRLLKCFGELNRLEKNQTTVNQVAGRWGFQDPYHFSRLFKRSYGVNPSDILLSRTPEMEGSSSDSRSFEGSTILRDWVASTF